MLDRHVGEVLALLKELGIEKTRSSSSAATTAATTTSPRRDHPRGVHSANKDPRTGVEFRGKKGDALRGRAARPVRRPLAGQDRPRRRERLPRLFPRRAAHDRRDRRGVAPRPTSTASRSCRPCSARRRPGGRRRSTTSSTGRSTAGRRSARGTGGPSSRRGATAWELYDLGADPGETKDLAAARPEVAGRLTALAAAAHQPVREGTFADHGRTSGTAGPSSASRTTRVTGPPRRGRRRRPRPGSGRGGAREPGPGPPAAWSPHDLTRRPSRPVLRATSSPRSLAARRASPRTRPARRFGGGRIPAGVYFLSKIGP